MPGIDILRNRSKHLAVALGAAGAIAGAGGGAAHAATIQPADHHQAAQVATHGKRKGGLEQPGTQAAIGTADGHGLYAGSHAALFGHHAAQAPASQPKAAGTTATPTTKTSTTTDAVAAPAAPQHPFTMYDAVNPSALPAGSHAAVYSDGAYAATPGQVAGHPGTLWIDTNTSNPHANVLDVEPGDATPQQAAGWVQQKLAHNPDQTAILYTMKSEWGATQDAVKTLPQNMQSHVKWWIADPTGSPHIVPGSSATQWYWGPNYDETMANPGF